MTNSWLELKILAAKKCVGLSQEYLDRFKFEIKEIEKQGANSYWLEAYQANKNWSTNPNGLVFPWLLGMTVIDPIEHNIPHKIIQQTDMPDIDVDYIPEARAFVKEHAIKTYGLGHVCNVGNWIAYKPKSALQDAARACGRNTGEIHNLTEMTSSLPDEFDELTIEDHELIFKRDNEEAIKDYRRYEKFYEYWKNNRDLVDLAYKLVGKIRYQGTHAGGLIIADRPIESFVPLSFMKESWTSQWTEGKSTQLSKFGLVKFDILGLKTMYYIWECCNQIKKNYNITIDWDRINPIADPPYMGFEISADGSEKKILMNDPKALEMCNALKTESVFQIETPIQKRIIKDGKVKTFNDLVAYNCLGRPGPIACCAEGSLISTDVGDIKIEQLSNQKIAYLSSIGVKYTNNYAVFANGKKKLFKVRLSNGKSIILTADHKIMTKDGFREVKNIKKGDLIYVKRRSSQIIQKRCKCRRD